MMISWTSHDDGQGHRSQVKVTRSKSVCKCLPYAVYLGPSSIIQQRFLRFEPWHISPSPSLQLVHCAKHMNMNTHVLLITPFIGTMGEADNFLMQKIAC